VVDLQSENGQQEPLTIPDGPARQAAFHQASRWTLETTAVNDPIKEAWLVVRVSDFHPVEQHNRFADDSQDS